MCPAGSLRFETVPPEPGRFWIRHVPRSWPGPEGWWIDIARAEPAGDGLKTDAVTLETDQALDDLVYLPPVEEGAGLLLRDVLQRASEAGVPVLQQVLPLQPIAAAVGPVVVDLTESLLCRRLDDLLIAEKTWAIWPLIPGLTEDPGLVSEGLDQLVRSGAAGVLPVAPVLTPLLRRQLAEFGSASSYSDVFHRNGAPQRAEFARSAAGRGLAVYPRRPALSDSRRIPNRRLSEHFALLAELWLACGRPEGRAQVYFSIARRLDEEPVDVGELARRGGGKGISWLDEEALSELRDVATGGISGLRCELESDLFGTDGHPA